MSAVSAIRPGAIAPGRRTDLLKVAVSENDPTMRVTSTAFGFRINGTASNSGTKASVLRLSFDGQKVSIPLSRGDTSQSVLRKLERELPAGYQARVLQSFRNMPPDMVIGIAPKPVQPKALKVKVVENDPALKVSQPSPTTVRISGTATNNGFVASFLKLDFDSRSVTVNLSRGDTSQHVVRKLEKALPKGYQVEVVKSYRNMPPDLVISVVNANRAS